MNEFLKVIKRERHFNDTEVGLTYITTLEHKQGKKGEPLYEKYTLKIQSGKPDFYNSVKDGEILRMRLDNPQSRLDDFEDEEISEDEEVSEDT